MKESPVSKGFIYGAAKNLRAAFSAARKVVYKDKESFLFRY